MKISKSVTVAVAITFIILSTQIVQAYETYLYSADYGVFGKVLKTETDDIITYTPSINIRDNYNKVSVTAWTAGQVSSTPDLAGVAGGVKAWKGTPTSDLKEAYTTAFNETWKVAQYIQQQNKLVAISISSITLVTKTGTDSFDLTTIPTSSW